MAAPVSYSVSLFFSSLHLVHYVNILRAERQSDIQSRLEIISGMNQVISKWCFYMNFIMYTLKSNRFHLSLYPAVFRRGIKKRAASAFVVLRFDVNVSFSAGQFCPLRNNRQFFLFSRYRAENDGQGLKFIVNDDETANSVKLQIRSLVCIKPRSPVLSGKRGFLGFYFCFSIILKPVSLSIFAASFLKF